MIVVNIDRVKIDILTQLDIMLSELMVETCTRWKFMKVLKALYLWSVTSPLPCPHFLVCSFKCAPLPCLPIVDANCICGRSILDQLQGDNYIESAGRIN